jgi:hypothetical protein
MSGNEDFSVKIYYINPIEAISVIIDTLINLEFEVYSLSADSKEKLLDIIPKENTRVIIFFSIINKNEVEEWLKYINIVNSRNHPSLQLGAFCYNAITDEDKNKFLAIGVPTIMFSTVEKNTLEVLQNILSIFEAKGKRAFVRVKAQGNAEVYFYMRNRKDPIITKIIDISAYAFSVEIDDINKLYFPVGSYVDDILLVLLGARIRITVKVLGFSQENPNIFIFKFCSSKIQDHKVVYIENIPNEVNQKIHNYIRKCLKRDIAKTLDEAE